MKKLFAYIRVSTVKQGLEEQRYAIEAYAQRNRFEIVRWFVERQTAAKRGRPVFTDMLRQLGRGQVAGVVIHKIDRGARNLRDWADLAELIDRGIEVLFANESLDLHSRGGRLSADIQAVVAADFIRNLREETRKGFYGRLKQGLYPMRAPVGYLDMGKGMPKAIDPVRGPLVRTAFEMYRTQQYSLDSLVEMMKERGLRNLNGGVVTRNGLSTILNNPFYIGLIRIRRTGETFPGCHKPLISKLLFDRVQLVLRSKSAVSNVKHTFAFRRLIRCSKCGYSLIGERQKGRVYYRCHTKGCPTAIREDALNAAVDCLLQGIRLSEERVDLYRERIKEIERNSRVKDHVNVQVIELQTKQLDDRLRRLTDAVIDGVIDRDTYEERKLTALLEQKDRKEMLRQLKAGEYPVLTILLEKLELANVAWLSYQVGTPEERRQLLKSVTSNRQANGKNIRIEPSEPFRTFAEEAKNKDGDPYRDGPRTLDRLIDRIIQIMSEDCYRLSGIGTDQVRTSKVRESDENSGIKRAA